MGAASEGRAKKHIRNQFDSEAAEREEQHPQSGLETVLERQYKRIGELEAKLDRAYIDLAHEKSVQLALRRQVAELQTMQRDSHEKTAKLQKAYTAIMDEFWSRYTFIHEALLLPLVETEYLTEYLLVHPAHGSMGTFKSLHEAQQWAMEHDGFIPRSMFVHSFHGTHYRVMFNLWPEKAK